MASREIIENLLTDLSLRLNDRSIVYERYRVPPINLEGRNDIPRARVALYEVSEQVTTRTGPSYANLSNQRYGIDISVVRAYAKDDASRGELPLMDLRDAIVDWANLIDAGAVTDCKIFTFGYDGNSGITRNDRYVTVTLIFTALRDLFTDRPDYNTYLVDDNGNFLVDNNNINLTP